MCDKWESVDIAEKFMREAISTKTFIAYRLKRQPTWIEIQAGVRVGVGWRKQNDGYWIWKNPNY